MKKLIFTAHVIFIGIILLNTISLESMQKIGHTTTEKNHAEHTHTKQIKRASLQAEEYNQLNPLIKLSTKAAFNCILPHCRAHEHTVNSLLSSIENFLALSVACKRLNTILTLETIGKLCTHYSLMDKDETLGKLLYCTNKKHYTINRLIAMILLYAGADVNMPTKIYTPNKTLLSPLSSPLGMAITHKDKRLVSLLLDYDANPNQLISFTPTLFNAPTKTIAQMLIDKGANIHAKNLVGDNILWHIVHKGNLLPAKLIKFYIEKGVDTQERDNDNRCILHYLACQTYPYNNKEESLKSFFFKDFFKKSTLLLDAIPEMINACDKDNKTPLDLAKASLKDDPTSKLLKKLIALLKKYGGKTTQ